MGSLLLPSSWLSELELVVANWWHRKRVTNGAAVLLGRIILALREALQLRLLICGWRHALTAQEAAGEWVWPQHQQHGHCTDSSGKNFSTVENFFPSTPRHCLVHQLNPTQEPSVHWMKIRSDKGASWWFDYKGSQEESGRILLGTYHWREMQQPSLRDDYDLQKQNKSMEVHLQWSQGTAQGTYQQSNKEKTKW